MTEGIVTPLVSNSGSTLRTSSGRAIGYGEFGDPEGAPVVLFHGFGDSRLTRNPDDALTARLGVRLITFDRPGIGLTDPMQKLSILDRTDDIIDLADALGLRRFAVLGWSGGAPFALAAAGCMADRVTRVGIASGFGPFERPGFKRLAPKELRRIITILKVAPWMSNVLASESAKQLQANPGAAVDERGGMASPADSSLLNQSSVRTNITAGAEEAFRQGPAGVAADMLLLFRFKWGFNPEDVHRPVELWYGDDDPIAPVEVGRGLASILPDARLRILPGGGHLLYIRYWEDILRTLTTEAAPRTVAPAPVYQPAASVPALAETVAAEPERTPSEPAPAGFPGPTPAWSWMQRGAQPSEAVETPGGAAPGGSEGAAEPQPLAEEREAVAADTVPPAREETAVAEPAGTSGPALVSDELERLRAAGFLIAEPEPELVAAGDRGDAGERRPAPSDEAVAAASTEPAARAAEAAEVEAPVAEAEPAATVPEGLAPETAHAVPAEAVAADVVAGEARPPEAEAREAEAPAAETPAVVVAEGETPGPEPAEVTTSEAAVADVEAPEAAAPEAPTDEEAPEAAAPEAPTDEAELERLRAAGFPVTEPEPAATAPGAPEVEAPVGEAEPPEAEAREAEAPAAKIPAVVAAEGETPGPEAAEVTTPEPAVADVEAPQAGAAEAPTDEEELERLRAAGFPVAEPETAAARDKTEREAPQISEPAEVALESAAAELEAVAVQQEAELSPTDTEASSPGADELETRAASPDAERRARRDTRVVEPDYAWPSHPHVQELERLRAAGFATQEPEPLDTATPATSHPGRDVDAPAPVDATAPADVESDALTADRSTGQALGSAAEAPDVAESQPLGEVIDVPSTDVAGEAETDEGAAVSGVAGADIASEPSGGEASSEAPSDDASSDTPSVGASSVAAHVESTAAEEAPTASTAPPEEPRPEAKSPQEAAMLERLKAAGFAVEEPQPQTSGG